MPRHSRLTRLRVLAVLAALSVSTLTGLAPVHAAEQANVADQALDRAGSVASHGFGDGGFTTQGWNWR